MINYGQMRSSKRPPEIEMTNTMVFVASNIETETKVFDERTITEYIYDYVGYTKDEYIFLIAQKAESLQEELTATKILLGVE